MREGRAGEGRGEGLTYESRFVRDHVLVVVDTSEGDIFANYFWNNKHPLQEEKKKRKQTTAGQQH